MKLRSCVRLLVLGSSIGLLVQPAMADDVMIVIKDGKFVPMDVTIPAGSKVKIVVRNQDATLSEFESKQFHREKTVAPGEAIEVFVGPLDPGTYEFYDDRHRQNRGHLIVQ